MSPNVIGQTLFVIITLSFNVSCSSTWVSTIAQGESIVKSTNDQRKYQRILLPNNLDVLLISDPSTDKAAAALDLYVGSYQNPIQRQGLAHFLEHMLFLGTKQFPESGAYQTFVSEHGGSHNASTGLEHTNYFFDINADYLTNALDRFAPFFTDPVFDAKYVDRERNAVESEYRLKYKNDGRRQWDVLREIANPNHPLSKFNVGGLSTLSDSEHSSVRSELIDFYDTYYSANLMTLAVLGKEPINELEKIVRDRFTAIKDKQVVIKASQDSFIETADLPMQVNVQPLKDTRELELLFELPKLNTYWQSKPAQYLASIIGDEGEGSLLQALKAKGWANSLYAGTVVKDRGAGIFTINIGLTPEGYKSRDQIVIELFAWIKLIKEKGIEQWRQQEQAILGEIAFRYAEKKPPAPYVTSIARNMHHYKGADILRGPYVISQYSPSVVSNIAAQLSPNNMLMFVTAPNAEINRYSQYYNTPYLTRNLGAEYVNRIKTGVPEFKLRLAAPNPFIPSELALIEAPSFTKPRLYKQQPELRVWHLQNTEFGTPKGQVVIFLRSKLSQHLDGLAATRLYAAYIKDQLNKDLYPALMAGLSYSISANQQGLSIVIGGYSDKQAVLLDKVIAAVVNPSWNKQRFNMVKEKLIREKENAKRDYPFRQVIAFFYAVLEGRWTSAEQAQALKTIDITQLQQFSLQLLQSFNGEILIAGNHQQASLERLIAPLDLINLKAFDVTTKVAKLRRMDINRTVKVDHNDAVLIQYIQGDTDSIKERATLSLLSQMISAPFYNELRTQKQLGYVVSAFPMHRNRVPGIGMLVQSPVASEQALKTAFNDFIQGFKQSVQILSEDDLERHKRALLVNIEKAPDNLSELSSRHLQSLNLGYEDFDFRANVANAIRSISVSEIQAAYQRLILHKPRRLWVQTQDGDDHTKVPADSGSIDQQYLFVN